MQGSIRTAVYIDGFNLYYWLKKLPYRWIDLKALALNAIKKEDKTHEIVAVKYFTANVSDTQNDRRKSIRQETYFRALQASTPELTITRGEFRRNKKQMPRVTSGDGVGAPISVWHTEEKGSDVNLAVELVNDAWLKLYDLAIVISNDSDLERALATAKRKGLHIGVLVRGDATVYSLRRVSNFMRKLTDADLRNALLPQTIPGTNITIPHEWAQKERNAGIR
ncbi:MAG: NYN domain-containing protein [Steroidobacteraceae bacterium]